LKVDYIIAGQGLAGSVLGLALEQEGADVLLVDPDEERTCSKIAGGLITPITGSRVVATQGLDHLMPHADHFYRHWESTWRQPFYHRMEIVRLWKSWEELHAWNKKRQLPDYRRHVIASEESLHLDTRHFQAPHGGIVMEGARLDTQAFLQACREHWLDKGRWLSDRIEPADLEWHTGSLFWKEVRAEAIIFCTGAAAAGLPWFSWAPWRNASGDILELDIPGWTESRVINGGSWLLPLGGSRVLAGATHDDRTPSGESRPEGRREMERRLAGFLRMPYEVRAHHSGIRPVFQGTRILMGQHPVHHRLLLFNGLASKGVLKAPWHAARLASHLCRGTPLPQECDIKSNL
jgi:glycine/D-amino acid oxidase-like deaminating enzyme